MRGGIIMGDFELQIFADRLKELRSSLSMTQAEFVKDLGITAAALSAYENNQKNPSISVAKRIADKYKISIDWLCGLSEEKYTNSKPETLSEILSLLFLLDECTDIYIFTNSEEYVEIGESGYPENFYRDTYEIGFKHHIINEFVQEWDKMRTLYNEGTIDNEVYALWKEKTIRKYKPYLPNGEQSVPFGNICDELPFN